MKKHILIFGLLIVSYQLISQENNDSLKITQFNIKTSPLTLIDPMISSAQIALEYRHKQDYALQLVYDIRIPSLLPYVRGKKNEKLLEYKIELKRFFQDELYLGLEYGYSRSQYDLYDDYFTLESFDNDRRDISLYNYESAHYSKTLNVINTKFGVQYNSRKHPKLLFDFFIGVGVRRVELVYTDAINLQPVSAFSQAGQGENQGHTFGIEQSNGSYIIDGIDQNNPPENAVNLGRNAQGVKNADGTFKNAEIETPVWDLVANSDPSWKGNFTFGIKIGYTLWSKY